ncbi:adenosine deaminase 2-like [Pectinophora gossypiella]|uniref:adenosine deaminase 2-like n=1 Tax=Pectinophora gossypiella TaxID=13191 RepID=UPI00214EF28D|nr:adenosine deaminase 2-like [Pectinophora gossypiella]
MTRAQKMHAYIPITVLWLTVISARTLDDYERNKTSLLEQEAIVSVGAGLRLSEDELQVNNILMTLKDEENKNSIANPENYNFTKHYFTYRDQIEKSRVYQIIKRMPKGAALHVHSTFVLDEEYMLSLTYEDHLYGCYVGTDLKLRFSDGVPQRPCPTNWTLLSELRNATDVEQFDSELKKRFTLYCRDQKDIDTDINAVWNHFDSIHSITKPLITYRPVREKYIYESLKRFYDDNVMYIEMRSGFHRLYELDGSEYDPTFLVRLHMDVTKRFIEDHPDFIGIKFILTKHRSANIKDIQEAVSVARKIKTEYPHMFAGFDLVGQEDVGRPLSEFLPALLDANDMDFFFHAGETNWLGMQSDENLIDAILLGTKRIGHGYALAKHPVLMSLVKKKDIAVEVNVISNAVLALSRDVRNHPLAIFLSFGLPVVLSSDDPGVWGAAPLSHDFYVAFMAVANQHSDLRLLKQLAINSIRYSALENRRKTRLFKVFNKRWSEFLKEVLAMSL